MKPVINVSPEKLVVKEGDEAEFSCTVEAGSPAPEVKIICFFSGFSVFLVVHVVFIIIITVEAGSPAPEVNISSIF